MVTLRKVLDRLTPISLQVYYGPNRGAAEYQKLGAYVWGCGPCAVHGKDVGGFVDSVIEARDKAMKHARRHLFARAVYDEG